MDACGSALRKAAAVCCAVWQLTKAQTWGATLETLELSTRDGQFGMEAKFTLGGCEVAKRVPVVGGLGEAVPVVGGAAAPLHHHILWDGGGQDCLHHRRRAPLPLPLVQLLPRPWQKNPD